MGDVVRPAPDRSDPPPRAPAADRSGDSPEHQASIPDAGSDDDASSTAADPFSGLAVAWFDQGRPKDELILLCDSTAPWMRSGLDDDASCVPDGQAVYVVDSYGVARWSVRARERDGRHLEPELVRPGARYPATSMPVLVMNAPPRASSLRLLRRHAGPPTKRTLAAARAVANATAVAEGGRDADDLPLRAIAEVRGTFGGGADTVAVFQVGEAAPDLAGHQVLAALSNGALVGLFGSSPLEWSGYQVVGVTDLDGDGHQELLWWAVAEGVGIGLSVSYFSNGEHRLRNLFACECGGAFQSAYPRRR